jgi:hypothetical protein
VLAIQRGRQQHSNSKQARFMRGGSSAAALTSIAAVSPLAAIPVAAVGIADAHADAVEKFVDHIAAAMIAKHSGFLLFQTTTAFTPRHHS